MVMPGGAKADVEKKSSVIPFDGELPRIDRVVVECECVGHLAGNENGVMGWRSCESKKAQDIRRLSIKYSPGATLECARSVKRQVQVNRAEGYRSRWIVRSKKSSRQWPRVAT